MKKYLGKTSLQYTSIFIFAIFVFLCLLWLNDGVEIRYPRQDIRFILVVCCCGLIYSCMYYKFYSDSIILTFLGIPIWKVHRSKVSGAKYMCYYTAGNGKVKLNCVLITIRPVYPFWGNDSRSLTLFKWKHPFRCMQINIPEGKDDEYIAMLEQSLGFAIKK